MSIRFVSVYLRLAIAAAFLSAVADRFGLWGAPGAAGVAWGDFDTFLAYTAVINPWVPQALIPLVGGLATLAEIVLGVTLLIGFRVRWSAVASGLLLLLFAVAMATTTGIKDTLDFSIWTASAASLLLALQTESGWSLDSWLKTRT